MNEDIFVSVMTSEFIYIPYDDKSDLSIKNLMVKKNELINVKDNICSPVSGKAYAYTEIPSLNGNAKSLIIENDFLDTMDNTFQVESIYKIDKEPTIINDNLYINVYLYINLDQNKKVNNYPLIIKQKRKEETIFKIILEKIRKELYL